MLDEKLYRGRCVKFIKGKTPTHGISEVRLNYLRTPLTTWDYLFFRITSYSPMARPLSLRGVPSGTTWQSPQVVWKARNFVWGPLALRG